MRTVPTINKVKLLEKSIDKHTAHDRSFAPYQGYTLTYPDGTEIFTIPGKPNESFTLERYKNEVGKPYNRITLYLALRSDVHAIGTNDTADKLSDSGESIGKKEVSPKTKIDLCLSYPTDSSQTTLCEMSNRASSKNCDIPDPVDEVDKDICRLSPLQSNSTSDSYDKDLLTQESVSEDRPLLLNNLKEIFPHKNTSLLEKAIESTNSTEDAVNYILQQSDTPAYDLYSTFSENSQFIESLPVDQLDDCPEDITMEARNDKPVSHYATNECLTNLLIDWASTHLEKGEQIRLKVRRQFVWQDVLLKLDRIEEGGHNKSVKVQFVGEPSVDQGGPRRELFTLINQHVGTSLVANGVFLHNVAALENKEFLRFGQLTALGLLQGSPGPKFFSPSVTNYILYGTLEKCTPTIDEMPCGEVKSSMENLANVTDEKEFKEKASFQCSFRFDAGYSKPFITLSQKEEFFRCIALHYIILVSLSELEQFIDGLNNCNVLQLIRSNAEAFRMIFESSNQLLTAELVDEIFDPVYSPVGSSAFVQEQAIMFNFNQLLEDIEQGKVSVDIEGQCFNFTIGDILQFVTGCRDVPAIGFFPRPSISFLHGDNAKQKLSANTCANILRLPVTEKMLKYPYFKEDITFCIVNSPGFGSP